MTLVSRYRDCINDIKRAKKLLYIDREVERPILEFLTHRGDMVPSQVCYYVNGDIDTISATMRGLRKRRLISKHGTFAIPKINFEEDIYKITTLGKKALNRSYMPLS